MKRKTPDLCSTLEELMTQGLKIFIFLFTVEFGTQFSRRNFLSTRYVHRKRSELISSHFVCTIFLL